MSGVIGIDIGGTFTDIVYVDAATGDAIIEKTPTSSASLHEGVRTGIDHLAERHGVDLAGVPIIVHGTTVATNAILERKLPRTALLVTSGFGDVLEIATMQRPDAYRLDAVRRPPAVARSDVIEVSERIDRDGNIVTELTEVEIQEVLDRLTERQVEAVAICLLFSFLNPQHEEMLASAITEALPGVPVVQSNNADPQPGEYVRANTTSVSASLNPLVSRYITELEHMLDRLPGQQELYIMQSNGGLLSPLQIPNNAHRLIMSGPAGGVVAATELATPKHPSLMTIDVGGTSSDICLIVDGRAPTHAEPSALDQYPIRTGSLPIHTIGAGGGSIATVDENGDLHVGPLSAGSTPGPVCYGRGGTQPTVTDAELVLGRLSPGGLLGGEMAIDLDAARAAIEEKIAGPLRLTWDNAAAAIIDVAVASMERGLRAVSVHAGYDPQDFALVTYGGGGPLHGCELANAVGVSTVIVPPACSTFSALGLLRADLLQAYIDARPRLLSALSADALSNAFEDLLLLATLGEKSTTSERAAESRTRWERFADVRYVGQRGAIPVPVPDASDPSRIVNELSEGFRERHKKLYGHASDRDPIEICTLRLHCVQDWRPTMRLQLRSGTAVQRAPRNVFFSGHGWLATHIFDRASLASDTSIEGPAIVEDRESTTIIEPGSRASLEDGSLIIDVRR